MSADARPFAWVLPGDDTARDDGFIDARISCEGEFTRPVYLHPPAPEPDPTARLTDADCEAAVDAYLEVGIGYDEVRRGEPASAAMRAVLRAALTREEQ